MKRCAFVVLFTLLLSSPALADDGRPDASALANLGLSSLDVVSDEEGQQVRGRFVMEVTIDFFASAGDVVETFGGIVPFESPDTVTPIAGSFPTEVLSINFTSGDVTIETAVSGQLFFFGQG